MKRFPLACVLFVFSVAVGSWTATESFAQNGSAPKPAAVHTPQSLPPPTRNVFETLSVQKNLGKFADMVDDADLKAMLSPTPDEPVTLFAPTDDAIDDIPSDVMKRIKASKASLQSFVEYHIITNSLVGTNAIKGRKISPASANGEALQFDGTNKAGPLKVNDADLVQSDIAAADGVIHVVSTALVPPSLKNAPPPPPAPAKPAAPAVPAAPVAPSAAAVSTSGATSPLQPTTTPATPPAETTTGAVPEVTPDNPAQEPPPAPAGDNSSKGFSLFGHTFGW